MLELPAQGSSHVGRGRRVQLLPHRVAAGKRPVRRLTALETHIKFAFRATWLLEHRHREKERIIGLPSLIRKMSNMQELGLFPGFRDKFKGNHLFGDKGSFVV